jgi:predicted Holliday junction resolvase-like endonuclease
MELMMDFNLVLIALVCGGLVIAMFYHYREVKLTRKVAYLEYLLSQKKETPVEELPSSHQRSIIRGQIAEQMAVLLPGFPFHPADYRHLGGQPLDFIAFVGLHRDGEDIDAVIIGDIKYGNSSLNPRQRAIKAAIDAGRVRWQTLRINNELTVAGDKVIRKGDTR